jgi:hypothetical protein
MQSAGCSDLSPNSVCTHEDERPSVAGLPHPFLDQAADKFFILSTGQSTTGLDVIVEITGNNVKMTRPIEGPPRDAIGARGKTSTAC